MKLIGFVLAAATLITAVSADPDPRKVYGSRAHGCYRPGMPCNKAKRAIEAATAILDEPVDTTSDLARRCFQDGQPCAKARRAEEALRATFKDADFENFADGKILDHHFNADGKPHTKGFTRVMARSLTTTGLESGDDSSADQTFCHSEGQQCAKVRRAAEAVEEALAKREADPEPRVVYGGRAHGCYRPGMPCNKKREADPRKIYGGRAHGCYRPGMPCNKAKRDLCFRSGEPCNNANRAIDYLDVAAADAFDYVTEDLPGSDYSE